MKQLINLRNFPNDMVDIVKRRIVSSTSIGLMKKVVDLIEDRARNATKHNTDAISDCVEKCRRNGAKKVLIKSKSRTGIHGRFDQKTGSISAGIGGDDEIEAEVEF